MARLYVLLFFVALIFAIFFILSHSWFVMSALTMLSGALIVFGIVWIIAYITRW
jgi:hypothetical protein